MQLSDTNINEFLYTGDITISDFDPKRLQPASYDVLLGNEFLIFDKHKMDVLDPKKDISEFTRNVFIEDDGYFILHPGEFALGVTDDNIGVSQKIACEIMGKSSLARLGLIIHTTAGFIDPGNKLNITLELFNTNSAPIRLYPKMKIAQIAFQELKTPASKSYGDKSLGSKYYGANSVQSSQMYKNF